MAMFSLAPWNGSSRGATVVVTGASAGVGRAVATAFARRGCRVGLIARGQAGLAGARRDCLAAGGEAMVLPCDVADAAAVGAAADRVTAGFGPIDIWINAAMVTVYAPLARLPPEEFHRVTEVTFHGSVHGVMAALAGMRGRDRGTIVQVGSSLAYRGIPLQSAYCAAKHALRGLFDSLRAELIHEGSAIRLSMVQLPAVNTPQFDWARNHMPRRPRPVPPIVQPEVAAEAVVYAAETAPRELWLDASTARFILAAMAAPGWLDRKLATLAWEGELDRQREMPGRPDNLFAPLPVDFGARGRFGAEAAGRANTYDPGLLRQAAATAALFGAGLSLGYVGRRLARRAGTA